MILVFLKLKGRLIAYYNYLRKSIESQVITAENKSHISEDICYMATVDNHSWGYLFDCGRARYLRAGDCKSLRAIFVTHTHIDHFCNFDTLLRHHIGLRRMITICGPAGIAKNVQAKGLGYTWNLIKKRPAVYEVIELHNNRAEVFELAPPKWKLIKKDEYEIKDGICFKEKGVSVSYVALDHKIPSLAYRLEEDSSLNIKDFPYRPGKWVKELKDAYEAGEEQKIIQVSETEQLKAKDLFHYLYIKKGHSLCYVMDHLASKENHQLLKKLMDEADEAVIEGFFRDCDRDYALRHYHSTVRSSAAIARDSGVKKLTLCHHSRRYFKEIQDIREEGMAEFENRSPKFSQQPIARYSADEDCDE
ncbi:MAG: peptidase [Planctomycetes bacterium]|nr:peptidase [Planctomycetota bacterium]